MKLYYWSDVEELADYATGEVIIMADSLQEALDTIRKQLIEAKETDHFIDELMKELKNTEPFVYDTPTAIWIGGSA